MRALGAFALGLGMMGITTLLPLVTRTIIDEGLTRRVPGVLTREIALLLGLAVLRWAFGALRRDVSGRVGTDVEYDLRNRLTRHLLSLEPAWHDQTQTGQLLSRATSDVRSVRYFLSWGLVFSVLNLFTFGIAAAQMWTLSARLTLVTLALAPPLVYGAIRFNRRLHRVYWRVQQKEGDLTTVVEENAAGVRVVKAFGRERQEVAKLQREAGGLLDENLTAARLRAFYTPLLAALPQLSMAIILWYGGRLVVDGHITLGTLVAFNSYVVMLAACSSASRSAPPPAPSGCSRSWTARRASPTAGTRPPWPLRPPSPAFAEPGCGSTTSASGTARPAEPAC